MPYTSDAAPQGESRSPTSLLPSECAQVRHLLLALGSLTAAFPRMTPGMLAGLIWVSLHPKATQSQIAKAVGIAQSGASRVMAEALGEKLIVRAAVADTRSGSLFDYTMTAKGITFVRSLFSTNDLEESLP